MGRMPKNKLPTAEASEPRETKSDEARERRYRAEDGLRSLNRAAEIKRDKSLMKDIKCLAKDQLKALK